MAKIFKPTGPWGKRRKPKRGWLVSEFYRFLAATALVAIVIGYFYLDDILPEVRDRLRPPGETSQKMPTVRKHKAQACNIKGNISVRNGERIYHVPGQEYYDETVIEPEKGERWFCSEGEARAAGWRKARV